MNKEKILNGLYEIMIDYIEDIPEKLEESMCIASDIGIDSFSLANMILAIEDYFHVEILDRDLGKFQTIGDMVNYLEEKIQ